MKRFGFSTIAAFLIAATGHSASAQVAPQVTKSLIMDTVFSGKIVQIMSSLPQTAAPARDGNIAIQQEFDTALALNTLDAWELFIQRHPDHPLAVEAKQHLEALVKAQN